MFHFGPCLIKPGLDLILRRLELLLRLINVFLTCRPVLGIRLLKLIIERFQVRFESSAFTGKLIFSDVGAQASGHYAAMLAQCISTGVVQLSSTSASTAVLPGVKVFETSSRKDKILPIA